MARLDYNKIKTQLKEYLENYDDLNGAKIGIEEDIAFSVFEPFINIESLQRSAPNDEQTISGGTKQNYLINISYSVWVAGLDREGAIKSRDDLISYLEIALISNRKLTTIDNEELFDTSWLIGGELVSEGIQENTFVAYGLLTQVARVSMSI